MKTLLLFLLNLLLFYFTFGEVTKSSSDVSKCKFHHSKDGYVYKQFYKLGELKNSKKVNANGTYNIVDMHFKVQAPRDAHLLLSQKENAAGKEPVYEIVLGAGRNTYSEIRRSRRLDSRASSRTTNLLSPSVYTSFWVRVVSDGRVEVGKEDEDKPLLSFVDPHPLNITHFSFATWDKVEANWYYDCPSPNEDVNIDSTVVERSKSSMEKLRDNLLEGRDPFRAPTHPTISMIKVTLQLQASHVTIDPKKTMMTVRSKVILKWIDYSLKWNASSFENTTHVRFNKRQIWQPNIVLQNSASSPNEPILSINQILVQSSGEVIWYPQASFQVLCPLNFGLVDWPRDYHVCDAILLVWGNGNAVDLVAGKESSDYSTVSGWDITSTSLIEEKFEASQGTTQGLRLRISLQRRSRLYEEVFYTIFIASGIFCLLSLWLNQGVRIVLVCGSIILLSLSMAVLISVIPSYRVHVPRIVSFHAWGLICSWIVLVVTIAVCRLRKHPPKNPPWNWLVDFLDSSVVRYIICLPGNKWGPYDTMTDTSDGSWTLITDFLEKVSFYIMFILFCVAIFTLH